MPCMEECDCYFCRNWRDIQMLHESHARERAPTSPTESPKLTTVIDLISLLYPFASDVEVIGPSCLPITVIEQDDGHVLIAELDGQYRKAVVPPKTKLAAFRVGDAVWVVPEDMVPPDPDLYGKTIDDCKSRFPSSIFTGEPRIPEEPKFTNKINFGSGMRDLSTPDGPAAREWESPAFSRFRFRDRSCYSPEDRSEFGDTPCKFQENPDDLLDAVRLGIHPPASLLNEDGCMVVGAKPEADTKIVISVYLDNGNVFEYDVKTPSSAREHVSAIIATGYRHSDPTTPDELVHFPPHRISKVKMKGPGITTKYYDRSTGT